MKPNTYLSEGFELSYSSSLLQEISSVTWNNLVAGSWRIPIQLALDASAGHIERAERELFEIASPQIGQLLGPAATIIDCGAFAGQRSIDLLASVERPKAVIFLDSGAQSRQAEFAQERASTAEISLVHDSCTTANWPLPEATGGRSLALVTGGLFGLWDKDEAQSYLRQAATWLKSGDLVLLTLEQARNGAQVETLYQDYVDHCVKTALARIGRPQHIEARHFFQNGIEPSLQFGALAANAARLQREQNILDIPEGTWINCGAMSFIEPAQIGTYSSDFHLSRTWSTQDGFATLVMLERH